MVIPSQTRLIQSAALWLCFAEASLASGFPRSKAAGAVGKPASHGAGDQDDATAYPRPRKDVAESLKEVLCHQSVTSEALWAKGLYDGQVEGQRMQVTDFEDLTEAQVWQQAKSFAAIRHSGGYVAGLCSAKVGWSAALPAPGPVKIDQEHIELPVATLNARCKKWQVRYVSQDAGRSKEVAVTPKGLLNSQGLGEGVVSVNCIPLYPRWLGQKTWYFIPTGGLAKPRGVPEFAVLQPEAKTPEDVEKSLVLWINRLRLREQLKPLILDDRLSRVASALTVSDSIDHDLHLMEQVSKKYSQDKFTLSGENRVKGGSVSELAWLLWHSPSHRDLLLLELPLSDQNLIGVAAKKINEGWFASIVVGSAPLSPVVKGPLKPKTRSKAAL